MRPAATSTTGVHVPRPWAPARLRFGISRMRNVSPEAARTPRYARVSESPWPSRRNRGPAVVDEKNLNKVKDPRR